MILIVLLISIIFSNVNASHGSKHNNIISADKNTRNSENKLIITCNATYKIMNHDSGYRARFQINLTNFFTDEVTVTLGRKNENTNMILVSFNPLCFTIQSNESKIIKIEMVGTEEIEIGIYNITIFAKDSNGKISSNYLNLTADYRLYKLKLSDEDITLSESNPEDGETIKIFINIHNVGNDNAKNISLMMYDNSKFMLTLYEISINANDTTTVVINWTATEGSHKIHFDLFHHHGPCSIEINVVEKENNYDFKMIGIFILIIIVIGCIMIWWKRRKKVI